MMQQLRNPHNLPSDHQVALFPTQSADDLRAEFSAQSTVSPATGPQVRVRKHAIRQVVVVQVAGPLSDVVEDLDRVIQLILAEEPRGVVCDLSGVFEGAESRPRLECWRQQGGMFATGPGSPWPWPARTRGSAKPCAPTPWVVA